MLRKCARLFPKPHYWHRPWRELTVVLLGILQLARQRQLHIYIDRLTVSLKSVISTRMRCEGGLQHL